MHLPNGNSTAYKTHMHICSVTCVYIVNILDLKFTCVLEFSAHSTASEIKLSMQRKGSECEKGTHFLKNSTGACTLWLMLTNRAMRMTNNFIPMLSFKFWNGKELIWKIQRTMKILMVCYCFLWVLVNWMICGCNKLHNILPMCY